MSRVTYGLEFSADAEITHNNDSDADVVSDNNTHEGE